LTINDDYPISIIATGIDNLHAWAPPGRPVYVTLETTNFDNDGTMAHTPSPGQVHAEIWLSIIHGVNGLIYVCHVFRPSQGGGSGPQVPGEHACLYTANGMIGQLAADDAQIKSLAPILNSPTVSGSNAVRVSAGIRVDVMTKVYGSSTYAFSEAPTASGGPATFTAPGITTGTATVLGEGRTIPISNGQFTDSLNIYGVHLYRITAG
jgi:hypothetical protein